MSNADVTPELFYRVWKEIEGLKGYFVKFTGNNADEAMQKTLMHTLTHYNEEKGNLSSYVKKLAREITKDNGRLVFVPFLEQTLSSSEDEDGERRASIDTGRVKDISIEVVNKIMLNEHAFGEIASLALMFMDKFILLCESIQNRDSSTAYYPESFIRECLRLSKIIPDFNDMCLELYDIYRVSFKNFLSCDDNNIGVWKEADYLLISQNLSKRIKLKNKETNKDVVDADIEPFYVSGNMSGKSGKKFIIKVDYSAVWEEMCDLVDSYSSNQLKFIIDNDYIIRTPGGSLSIINPDLFNIYSLLRDEILTNVIRDTNGRVLNVGSSCIYMLCTDTYPYEIEYKYIKGIKINLIAEDITDSIS